MIHTTLGTPHSAKGAFIADRRLFLNAQGEVVEANDPTRVALLVAKGGALPYSKAVELGLIEIESDTDTADNQDGTDQGTDSQDDSNATDQDQRPDAQNQRTRASRTPASGATAQA